MENEFSERDLSDQRLAQDGINALSKMVNNMGFGNSSVAQAVAEKFVVEHRTLQQSMLRFLYTAIQFIVKFHEAHPNYTDMRNEGGIKWLQEVAKIDGYFPHV